MDFFCVRVRPRYSRGNHSRKSKKEKKKEKRTTTAQAEAQPEANPTRRKTHRKQAHRRSRTMAHSHSHADFPAPAKEQHCPCASCHSHLVRPPTRNSNCDHGRDADRHKPEGPAYENQPRQPQVNQVYVHPYSTYHYRFPVVDHSATCYGHRITPYPACYTALVPEAAAVRDIETTIAHRPGLIGMVRLSATNELVHIGTFHSIRALDEASLQLEVWDSENAAGNE